MRVLAFLALLVLPAAAFQSHHRPATLRLARSMPVPAAPAPRDVVVHMAADDQDQEPNQIKSLAKQVVPKLFFLSVPAIIGEFFFEQWKSTGFDPTLPLRMGAINVVTFGVVVGLVYVRAQQRGVDLFRKKED